MSLRQYITEAEIRQHVPETGDVFAIELEDGTLLETYIMSINAETILLDATPKIIDVLREWADLEGEADDVLFEGQFKQSMQTAAESMSLEDFVERYGHLFSPKEAEQFWNSVNSTDQEQVHEYHDYQNEQDVAHQDSGEYDYEGDMAKDDLYTIIRAARRLNGMLDDNENMPEWVQSKITKAADYVDTAADYIESNKERADDEPGITEGIESFSSDELFNKVRSASRKAINQTGDQSISSITVAVRSVLPSSSVTKKITSPRSLEALDSALGDEGIDFDELLTFLDKKAQYWGKEGVAEGHDNADDYQAKAQWLRQNLHVSPDEAWEMAYDTDPDTWVGSPWEDDYKQGMDEAKYQGREVKLGKPTRGDVKKFKVYVRDPATGNIKKVNFGHGGTSAKRAGQKTMKIRKSDPARRRSFRARHNCDNPGPRTKARYWSCRKW